MVTIQARNPHQRIYFQSSRKENITFPPKYYFLYRDCNYRPCKLPDRNLQKSVIGTLIRYSWIVQLICTKFLDVIGEYSLLANPLLVNLLHMIKKAFQVDLLMRPVKANIRYWRIRYWRTLLYQLSKVRALKPFSRHCWDIAWLKGIYAFYHWFEG